MTKIFIDYGHYANDSGAVGNGLKEVDINKSYGKYLAEELGKYHDVRVGSGGSLSKRVQESNSWGSDLFISCHTNAGGGDGFEVFVYKKGANAEKCANSVYNQVTQVDKLNNGRGVKEANFYVIKNTNCPAILTECAFIDSADIKCIDTVAEQKEFGVSIAKGVLKYLGTPIPVKPPVTVPPVEKGVFYRVVADGANIGSYSVFENASTEALKQMKNGKGKIELVRVVT